MMLQHAGEQRILAVIMGIERAFGDARAGGDLVHAHARIATPVEHPVGARVNAGASDGARARHERVSKYTDE